MQSPPHPELHGFDSTAPAGEGEAVYGHGRGRGIDTRQQADPTSAG